MTRQSSLLFTFVIIFLIFAVYGQLYQHGFISIDDHVYVTENEWVKEGLSLDGIVWAFTTTHAEFWHPLTWVSLMLDTSLFGGGAGGYLLINVCLHLVNSLLLWVVLSLATGYVFRSWLVGVLFAIHPLHVESVAWISDRKDLLCAFFWLWGIYFYLNYTKRISKRWYVATLLSFVFALMSKPTAVMFPIILLLCDLWPLERVFINSKTDVFKLYQTSARLLAEKLPFFGISVIGAFLAFYAQQSGGGIISGKDYSFIQRFGNIAVSLFEYARKTILPYDLAIFYPITSSLSMFHIVVSSVFIISMTIYAIRSISTRRYILVGWFWFCVTLVPVLGFVKVGDFSMADRYMYLPIVGLLVIIVWSACDFIRKREISLKSAKVLCILPILVLSIVSFFQVSYWRDSESVFRRAIYVRPDSYMGHYGLANTLIAKGRDEEAHYHLRRAVDLRPDRPIFLYRLASFVAMKGDYETAGEYVQELKRQRADSADVRYLAGMIAAAQFRPLKSIEALVEAVLLKAVQESDSVDFDEEDIIFWKNNIFRSCDENKRDKSSSLSLAANPSCVLLRFHLAGCLLNRDLPTEAFNLLYIEQTEEWYRRAFGRGMGWWLTRFPEGSMGSITTYLETGRCKAGSAELDDHKYR